VGAPGAVGPTAGVPPYLPAPPRRARQGLSTAAIVVIVVVVVLMVSVVPAAVLYVLVSGLSRSTGITPGSLGPTLNSTVGPVGTPPSYYVSVYLSPTPGLSTGEFGLEVSDSAGHAQSVIAASAHCVQGAGSSGPACVAGATGWYAVLLGPTSKIVGTYSLSGGHPVWTNLPAGSSAVALSSSDTLLIVSSLSFANDGYSLSAFGTGSTPVWGTVSPL